jgi:hypothetical protein
MRIVAALALLSCAVPAAANAGVQRNQDQSARVEGKRSQTGCTSRSGPDGQRMREAVNRTDCRVTRPLPPVLDPTPLFLP